MLKTEIRRKIKDLRLLLNEADKASAAMSVFARVEATAAFQLAEKILIYHSLPDELDTRSFLNKWKGTKRFFLPRVNGVNLEILPYDESRLEIGSFHIEEPTGSDLHPIDEIELIIVPGVAFDSKGNRMGRGKGYYDRMLGEARATKMGVGYDFQLCDEIPVEPHDIPMDIVVTQTTTIIVGK